MDEQKELVPQETEPQPQQAKAPQQPPVRHTWVTNLYDRLNIPVRVLDFLLVFLGLFILVTIIIASQNH